jgi:hypothetical protein
MNNNIGNYGIFIQIKGRHLFNSLFSKYAEIDSGQPGIGKKCTG